METKVNRVGLGALALGHLVVDMQTSSLAVMIPLLYSVYNLDYASAAIIITLNNLTSSFIQPLFGIISDRKPLRWLLPLGCIVASTGIVLVLFMPDYWLVLVAVIGSGLGSAAYHPEGSRNANYVSGAKKATGVSVFFVGGNLGYTLGPIFTTFMIGLFGKNGVLFLLGPGLIGCVLLWKMQPLLAHYADIALKNRALNSRENSRANDRKDNVLGKMSLLLGIISFRSVIQTGMVTFIPFYILTQPGGTKEYAAFLLAVFLFAGAVGTLLGGRLADKFGSKTVMIVSMIITCPMLLIFINTTGIIQLVTIAIAGSALISASSVTVVMAQATMPKSIGLASGLTLGLGFGAGGLGAAALGKFADWQGLFQTMLVISLLPIIIIFLSSFIDRDKKAPVDQPVPVTTGRA